MNHWIQTLGRGLFAMMPTLLLTAQVVAVVYAADQLPNKEPSPVGAAPGRIAVSASLDADIRAVDAMMSGQAPVLMADLKWLKAMAYLCRRTKTDIEREATKAQANIAELQKMRQSGYLEPDLGASAPSRPPGGGPVCAELGSGEFGKRL